MVWVIDNLVTMVEQFTAVAMSDPLSAVLVTLGGLITGFAGLFFAYLVAGGLLDVVTPDVSSRPPEAGH